MAELTLYPRYITANSGFDGILSANGTGEAYRTMGVGTTDIDIGTIAFENSQTARKSDACTVTGIQTRFELKNGNNWATNDIQFFFKPYIVSGSVGGNSISILSRSAYGEERHNEADAEEWVVKTFDYLSQSVSAGGFFGEDKYLAFFVKLHRYAAFFKTQAYMRRLKATLTYTPRYKAAFYGNDNNPIGATQTLDAGVAPTAPTAANIENYKFSGWRDNASGTVYAPGSIPAGYDEDVSYTAVYEPIMHTVSAGEYDGTHLLVHAVLSDGTEKYIHSGRSFLVQQGTGCTVKLYCHPSRFTGQPVYDVSYRLDGTDRLLTRDDFVDNGRYEYTVFSTDSLAADVSVADLQLVLTELAVYVTVDNSPFPSTQFVVTATRYMGAGYWFSPEDFSKYSFTVDRKSGDFDFEIQSHESGGAVFWFTNIKTDGSINIVRDLKEYEVHTSTDGHGSIIGKTRLSHGSTNSFRITPHAGYGIRDVKLDGVSVIEDVMIIDGGSGLFVLADITGNHVIEAEFLEVVQLTLTVTGNGSVNGYTAPALGITSDTILTVPKNEPYLITAIADENNSVDTVTVDGVRLFKAVLKQSELATSVTPGENMTVSVSFTDGLSVITVAQPENGRIFGAASGTYLNGSRLVFEAVPDAGSGFNRWDDDSVQAVREVIVALDATVSATFIRFTYHITTKTSGEGRVVPSEAYGELDDSVCFTAVPADGYRLNEWRAIITLYGHSASSPMGRANPLEYPITGLDHELIAMFVKDFYALTVEATQGGTVTGSGTFEFESVHEIGATPDEGYYFFRWSDGDCLPARSVTIPAGNLTLTAEFRRIEFKVDVDAGEGGAVELDSSVYYGDNLTIDITNDIGYKISDVTVNGSSVFSLLTVTYSGGSLVLPSVKSNVNVKVFFAEKEYRFTRRLLDYYPPVIQKILEFIKLTDAQQQTVGEAWDDIDFVMSSQFIDSATLESVKIWEKELNVIPKAADTLTQRKQRLKALWVPNSRYTLKWLRNWLLTFSAAASGEVNAYTLAVELPTATDYAYLANQIRSFIPANINLNPKISLTPNNQKLYAATICVVGITKTSQEPEVYNL